MDAPKNENKNGSEPTTVDVPNGDVPNDDNLNVYKKNKKRVMIVGGILIIIGIVAGCIYLVVRALSDDDSASGSGDGSGDGDGDGDGKENVNACKDARDLFTGGAGGQEAYNRVCAVDPSERIAELDSINREVRKEADEAFQLYARPLGQTLYDRLMARPADQRAAEYVTIKGQFPINTM
jgi:hypothetical protein